MATQRCTLFLPIGSRLYHNWINLSIYMAPQLLIPAFADRPNTIRFFPIWQNKILHSTVPDSALILIKALVCLIDHRLNSISVCWQTRSWSRSFASGNFFVELVLTKKLCVKQPFLFEDEANFYLMFCQVYNILRVYCITAFKFYQKVV